MNTTEQITRQIDGLVSLIAKYGRAVRTEEARTTTARKTALSQAEQEKSKIAMQESQYLANAKNARDSAVQHFDDMKNTMIRYEARLERLVPRKRIRNIPPPVDSFSPSEADALLHRIQETGFWVTLKKLLSIGAYGTNKKMAAELYGEMDSACLFYDNEKNTSEQTYRNRVRQLASIRLSKESAVQAQLKQRNQQEDAFHASKLRDLEQQKKIILSDSRYQLISSLLQKAEAPLGFGTLGWQHYSASSSIPENLLVGTIIYPCGVSAPIPAEMELLKRIPSYIPSMNGFSVPLTVPGNRSLQICANTQHGDVMLAAEVFQSIIARLIRFMPQKSFRGYFFDPVNRGTALGDLIHLSGDGTSEVCKYALFPQDITAQLEELTKTVDKTCRRLTAAGCKDINAFNSIPKGERITYTAVVIHDYPNGLDSTALGYLQVLMSKAQQCGITILVSVKAGDKIEHKAKEILDQMHNDFWTLQIPDGSHAVLNYSSGQRRYKPNIPKIDQSYFTELNRAYTYRAPINNSFQSIFSNPPVLRSAKKGLNLPFAVTRTGALVDLEIGYDHCAYGFVSGGVGSGKTTMLHMLIASAAMHYAPEDLELWLIDYKVAEFAFYQRNRLPHIRFVIADNSDEITYSILDELSAEISRRNKAFVQARVKDYVEYADCPYGKAHRIPRLLVIIDEFHRMAQAAQEESNASGKAYSVVLENIFAEARSAGVVLLLCDQEMSNGLTGLSQKSRDMIASRLAMRNKSDEIRETLSVESGQLTDELKKAILDASSGLPGSVIYRHETAGDPNDPFSNKIEFLPCRAVFAREEDRVMVANYTTKRSPAFHRDQVFYFGAARKNWSISEIKDFEKTSPQRPDQGQRIYIGTPLGIQRCFYFNLKHGESGENVLLVGSDSEKRISILKSVLSCAGRYGYQIYMLASKSAQLYRQNKEFFQGLNNIHVLTGFPEICKFIGERANKLRSFYSDDEDDGDRFGTQAEKTLAIFVGLEELYAQMDASPYTQSAAWAAPTAAPVNSAAGNSPAVTPLGLQGGGSGSPGAFPTISPTPSGSSNDYIPGSGNITPMLQPGLDDIENLLKSLSDDSQTDKQVTVDVPPKFAGPAPSEIKGYNAISDLALLLSDGWKLGVNLMMVLDRGTSVSKLRQLKIDDNFNHRIALTMSSDEAQIFLSKTRLMKSLADESDTISAVYSYLGGREQCFRPYIF